ncbi:MAG: NAD-dependent protein deacetylase 1 [Micrococcales bacterium]|nr:NAD-dependent protein deacetylase 1 [Micrococcales bacterium]
MHHADEPEDLADLLHDGAALVLSGAGLSTESGIPDYRGPDGRRRVTPMHFSEFRGASAARQRYWARSFIGWQRFTRAEPNAGHRAVAGLESRGLLHGIITQNVDGLHQQAGARAVVELHGSLARVVCLGCGDRTDREALQRRMTGANAGFEQHVQALAADGSQVSSQIRPDGDIVLPDEAIKAFSVPRCVRCASDLLKPDVVFFGESVPSERVEQCFDLVEGARSLVVLGSSLAVMSGFRFVRRGAARGIPIAIATASETRGDPLASLRLHGPLGQTLERVVASL